MNKKVLVAGWFSFEQMGATAGDLLSCELTCEWLRSARLDYDVCLAAPFKGGVDWQTVDPDNYSHVVFVCGPFGNGWPLTEFLPRFAKCKLLGLNVSMLEPLTTWNPFNTLLERDSSRNARPDVTFLTHKSKVPVVGVVLVHPQKEYKDKMMHQVANDLIEQLIQSQEMAVVRIDTRLDQNTTHLRTPAEIESLIARMDIVITTRLHGTVLALKNGVPVIAIDPVAGGAKVFRQAQTVGWQICYSADTVTETILHEAFQYCLTEDARMKAQACCIQAKKMLAGLPSEFIHALTE